MLGVAICWLKTLPIRDILRKMSELSVRLIPCENGRRKTWRGPRALSSSSVPPESIVGEARCQPCAINHPLSEGGRQGGDPPPRTGGWKFSCPPRLLKPRAATDRTTTAGLAIRAGPRPGGPPHSSNSCHTPLPPRPPPSLAYPPPPPPTSNHYRKEAASLFSRRVFASPSR